ncbi:hypothetical protein BaRGS_00011525 [Batillaria attramentaria]|uniref:Uncharacterized protein n=1 Tax=Batillaria attramentaria TaxID=370345 RepID=A0ABD0LCL7_9CAEN
MAHGGKVPFRRAYCPLLSCESAHAFLSKRAHVRQIVTFRKAISHACIVPGSLCRPGSFLAKLRETTHLPVNILRLGYTCTQLCLQGSTMYAGLFAFIMRKHRDIVV